MVLSGVYTPCCRMLPGLVVGALRGGPPSLGLATFVASHRRSHPTFPGPESSHLAPRKTEGGLDTPCCCHTAAILPCCYHTAMLHLASHFSAQAFFKQAPLIAMTSTVPSPFAKRALFPIPVTDGLPGRWPWEAAQSPVTES
jgi:hypothetical protein